MKKLLSLFVVLAIAGIVLWFTKSATELPAISIKTAQSVSVAQPAVEKPVVAPVPTQNITTSTQSTRQADADPPTVVRAELKAAISDWVNLLDANNVAAFNAKFIPPSIQEKRNLIYAQLQANRATQGLPPLSTPTGSQIQPLSRPLQLMLQELQSIENSTPKLNIDNDEAEYSIDPTLSATLPGNPKTLYFHKEDGQWYRGPKR